MEVFLNFGRLLLNFIYMFHKLCPTKKRISIVSRQYEKPSKDIRLLVRELARQSPDTEVVVSCRMIGPGIIDKISYALYMVTEQMHLFATSQVVVLDGYCICACMLNHKKSLKIVQMWHAMGAFKKFGYSSMDEEEGRSSGVARAMRMHKNYDVIFVSSKACKELMAPAFGCDPDLMEVMPLPSADLILSKKAAEKNRERIYARYPQLRGRKVILYAPTFRKNKDIAPYIEALIEAVAATDMSLVVKLHPIDHGRVRSGKAIIDKEFTSQEMLSIADAVVTDYSAFVFEAASAGKPIYRYVPDDKEYDHQRGFLMDPDQEIPAYTSGEAKEVVTAIQENRYDREEIRRFAHKYIDAGGHYTRNMARYILNMAG